MLLSSVLVLVMAAVAQVADPHQAERDRQSAKAAMFSSPRIGPVASPERVELLPVRDLLDRLRPGQTASQLGLAAHFKVIQEPHPIDDDTERALRSILLNPESYGTGVSACVFSPILALRCWSGATFVDVLIGDGCYQVAFAENGRDLLGYFVLTEGASTRIQQLVAKWRPRDAKRAAEQ